MIKRAKEITEPEKKQHMVNSIANFMKMAYVLWNKDHVADEQIISDLNDLSGGELDLSQVILNRVDVKQNTPSSSSNNGRSQKNNNQNNRGGGGQRHNNNNQNNNKNRPRNFQNNGGGKRSN